MFAVSFPAQLLLLQQRQLEQTHAPVPGILLQSPAVIPRETHLHEKLEAMHEMGQLRWGRCLAVPAQLGAVTISKGGTHRWGIQEGQREMSKSSLCNSEQASRYTSTKRTL